MINKSSMTRTSMTDMTQSQLQSSGAKFGCRHIQILLYAIAYFCCCGILVIPSITLLAMEKSSTGDPNTEVYVWSESIKNMILSSFLWGFTVTLMPSAHLAQRFGVAKVYYSSIGLCGFSALLTPIAAQYGGWHVVLAIRILTGALQGICPPAMYILMSKWVPVVERGRAGSRMYACGLLGFVAAFLTSGAISDSVLGWQSCYYFWGGITMLWTVVYHFVGKQSPADHLTISLEEKEYIENSYGVTDTTETLKTPWSAIFTSIPVWALVIIQCANNWGAWVLLAKMPAYMANVLGYNIFENGIMTAIPHLVACLVSFPFSYFCDRMVKDGRASLTSIRKIANSVGLLVPAVAFIGLSFLTSEYRISTVAILITAVGFNVAVSCGYFMNPVDLSPNFSGVVGGISHTAANIIGLLAPLLCGVIVPDITNIDQWRRMFYMTSGFYVFGNMIFVFFGDATVQSWNEPTTLPKVDNDTFIIPTTLITTDDRGVDEKKN